MSERQRDVVGVVATVCALMLILTGAVYAATQADPARQAPRVDTIDGPATTRFQQGTVPPDTARQFPPWSSTASTRPEEACAPLPACPASPARAGSTLPAAPPSSGASSAGPVRRSTTTAGPPPVGGLEGPQVTVTVPEATTPTVPEPTVTVTVPEVTVPTIPEDVDPPVTVTVPPTTAPPTTTTSATPAEVRVGGPCGSPGLTATIVGPPPVAVVCAEGPEGRLIWVVLSAGR